MTDKTIIIAKTAGIANVSLNRPDKRNAMNGQLINEFANALTMLAEDKQIRVLIISGKGDHFCAGADLAWMREVSNGSYDDNYDDAKNLADMMYQLYAFPKPTIVLAHGAVLGGGLGLLAACDIAIATTTTNFGFPEVKVGVAPSTISPYILLAIGERAAHYYFLTGERFDANEAYRLGLVHRIVGHDELVNTGLSLAESMLENAPLAMMEAKQLLRHVGNQKISDDLCKLTAKHLAKLRTSPEAKEGLKAFLEKRSPNWK